ncbi:VRR-NUC domain-containing protein [Candidatus Dependentiae bacterium]|nr:VRR-NUC domain-containing protein [Candidatus Dependentiae bacterium]
MNNQEKYLEKKLRDRVKEKGGLALKFVSPAYTGVPDRIVLMPGGKARFVELKTEGRTPSERQKLVIAELRKLGFSVSVISTNDQLTEFLNCL